MELEAVVRHYRVHFQQAMQRELVSFRDEKTLEGAVRRAALAETSDGRRHRHHRRRKREALDASAETLRTRLDDLRRSTNFAKLHEIAESALRVYHGLGELYIYDVALRIGAKLSLLPQRVYMHSGTRKGAEALGLPVKKRKALDRFELPAALRELQMHEVEDLLCIYKKYFSGDVTDLEAADACWEG